MMGERWATVCWCWSSIDEVLSVFSDVIDHVPEKQIHLSHHLPSLQEHSANYGNNPEGRKVSTNTGVICYLL